MAKHSNATSYESVKIGKASIIQRKNPKKAKSKQPKEPQLTHKELYDLMLEIKALITGGS